MTSDYYSRENHGNYEYFEIPSFDLEHGGHLRNLKIAYETFGQLSPRKDNAILFPTWYSGTSKIIEMAYIGADRALDPSKYFIIVVNQIGNGLSSAAHNTNVPFNGARFPNVTIADDVRAQHALVTQRFGIEQLQLVLGGSMGAQQTYEWAVRYPEMVVRAAPIAGTARATPHNKLIVETFQDAITSDPHWDGGWYTNASQVHRGLRRHARLFAASGFTAKLFNSEGWRGLGFTSPEDFVTGFVEGHFLPQDPNNLLSMLRKWHAGDVSRMTGGCLKTALGKIKSRTAIIAIKEDLFFPLGDIEAEAKMIQGGAVREVSSDWGHLALFGIDQNYNAVVDSYLRELLAN